MSGGYLGLEGMSDGDIRKMHGEFREEDERYRAALAKALRWVKTHDKPDKTLAWRLAELFFGVRYEDAFRRGWFLGNSEGSYQESKKFRAKSEAQPNIESSQGEG